ncbi:tRNA-specific adenosine deaminase subunit TAD2 [Spathaspora sp. JA1]|nr:tRNA-specific adenosine deaminase subunit TAD2 [Spathaspora sp. JA1]
MTDLTPHFHDMALSMFIAYKALKFNETPVACIIKHIPTQTIISIGYNYTNTSLNGTQHAEFIATQRLPRDTNYSDLVVYVTVEPCIMCASLLRQLGISKVYYGCNNDRFGGTGTVLSVHSDVNLGDGIYDSIGGIMRCEAIQLLRNFYIQENESAPTPKVKKNKQIELKQFPKNEFNISKEKFIENYGSERSGVYESVQELTPVFGKGYCMEDVVSVEDLYKIPFLSKELGEITQGDVEEFYSLFFDVNDDGEVNYDKVIEKYDAKKRKLD